LLINAKNNKKNKLENAVKKGGGGLPDTVKVGATKNPNFQGQQDSNGKNTPKRSQFNGKFSELFSNCISKY